MRVINFGCICKVILAAIVALVIFNFTPLGSLLGVSRFLPSLPFSEIFSGTGQEPAEPSEAPSGATPEAPAPQKAGADVSEAGKSIVNALSEIGKSEALTPITRKITFPIISPDKPISVCWGLVWIIIGALVLRFGLPKILGLFFGGLGSGIDSLKNNVGQKMTLFTILVIFLLVAGASELAKIIRGQPLFSPELSKGIVTIIGLILALIDFKGRTSWQWNNASSAWKNIWSSQSIEFPTKVFAFLFHAFATPIFIAAQLAITDIFLVFLTGFSVTGQIVRSFGAQPLAQLNSANIPIFSWILGIFAWFASGSLNFSAAASQQVGAQAGLTQLLVVWGLAVILMIFKFGRRGSAGF